MPESLASRPFLPQIDRRTLVAAALLPLLTLVAYVPAMTHGGFIWDDPQYVINNQTLRTPAGLLEMWTNSKSLPQWYPLTHTTFWIEFQWWGANPIGYHVTNVALHVINALLLWRLLVRLDVPGAWLAAAIFAVHPVCVESVAWITERKNVLSLLFYLLAMRAYLVRVATDPPKPITDWRGYAVVLVLFACALFSKTVTSTLPAAILLILWWKREKVTLRDVALLVPFFVMGITMAVVTSHIEHTHVGADPSKIAELNFSLEQRLFIAGRAIWFYAGKLLWPANLVFIYPRWPSVEQSVSWLWLYPLSAIGVIASLFAVRRRIGRGPLVAVLLFCGTLVPALGFVSVYPMRFSFVADHFQYHASVGLLALLAAMVWHFVREAQAPVAAAAILLPLTVVTYHRSTIYADALTLWNETLRQNSGSWMVWTNMGNALAAVEKYDDAIPMYMRALELAPNLDETNWNAGVAFVRRGLVDDAENKFRRAIQINPQFPPAYADLGKLYLFRKNDPTTAETYFKKALEIAPDFADANYGYGVLLQRVKRTTDAIDRFRLATAAKPDFVEAHYDLAVLLINTGGYDEAIAHLLEVVQLRPTYPQAWQNLGVAQLGARRPQDAAKSFETALRIDPTFAPAAAALQRVRGGSGSGSGATTR